MANDEDDRSTVPPETVERNDEETVEPRGGLSIRALAATLGVSPATVHRDRRGADAVTTDEDGSLLIPMTLGIDGRLRPTVRYDTSGRDRLIRQLRHDGKSIRVIAQEVGCSVGTVHRVLARG